MNKNYLIISVMLLLISNSITSQVSELENVGTFPASFVGWDATAAFALNINHKALSAASDINFLTRNTQRMVIDDAGRLGLGLVAPNALLHVQRITANGTSLGELFRTTGLSSEISSWTLFTGATSGSIGTEKFRLWTDALATPWVNQTCSNSQGFKWLTPSLANGTTVLTRLGINGFKPNTSINGFNVNTSGFVAITQDNALWNASGPVSLLTLSGSVGNTGALGYRPWMKDGITYFANNDMCYIGPMAGDGGVLDRTDFTLCWGDNNTGVPGAVGPDNMKFICTQGAGVANGYNDNLTGEDLDGREIMRLTGTGNVGIGPNFTNAAQPQADLHIHTEYNPLNISLGESSIQLSLDQLTGGNAVDGFRISVNEFLNTQENGAALLRQYENNSIRFISAYNDIGNPMGERMRITAVTDSINGNNPGNMPLGTTRISMSSNGASPLTKARSVLHIGTNMDTDNDGWRKWMNVGTLNSQGDKHCYFGVRPPESGTINTEAVVGWGKSNFIDGASIQMPLRFIFTSDTSSTAADEKPAHENGREIARMLSNGQMGVGTQVPDARLDIFYSCIDSVGPQYGIRSTVFGGLDKSYGGYFSNSAPVFDGDGETYGVYAISQGSHSKNWGGYFQANNVPSSNASVGAYGLAGTLNAVATNTGLSGSGQSGKYNYGVRGSALGANVSAQNVGVYGEASGIGDNWAMWAAGEVFTTGTGFWQTSDENLKQNIQDLGSCMEVIDALSPKTYDYRCEEYPQLHLAMGQHCGFIAQEVEALMPTMVKEVTQPAQYDDEGNMIAEEMTFKAMNYGELHAVEIAAIKELKSMVETQQGLISTLQEQLNSCCTVANDTRSFEVDGNVTEKDVTLSNRSIVLNQNVPNPFAEQTTINYNINEDFSKAQILFYDANGKLIQATDITTKGAGQLNVFADDLTSGVYSYALVVDGEIIDSKKMMKQ